MHMCANSQSSVDFSQEYEVPYPQSMLMHAQMQSEAQTHLV